MKRMETLRLGSLASAAASFALTTVLAAAPLEAARAATVVNGDFETGDFTGWSTETDGQPGTEPDFSVVASGGGSAARIEADYYGTPGDVDSVPQDALFIANTLHQPLDLSAVPGQEIQLGFAWTFDGEGGSPSAGEVFVVGLTDATGQMFGVDGQPGYVLAPTTAYGSGTFSAALDPAVFNGASGWTLEIQLLVGVDPELKQHDALGSYVEIDDVSAVPEPGVLAALVGGVALLSGLQRRRARLALLVSLVSFVSFAHADAAGAWTDLSSSAELTTRAKGLDRVNGVLFSYARVTNQSGGLLSDLRLVVTQPSVPVENENGATAAAEPYFDLPALADGETATVRIEFPLARVHVGYGLRLEGLVPAGEPLAITTAPSLAMDPNGVTPLAGVVTAATNIPARATLTATSTSDSFIVEFHEYTTDHSLPLLGLRPDSSYTVDVTFTDPDENSVASGSLVANTGPLPADLADIDVLVNVPGQKEPGYTWVDTAGPYAVLFDQDAQVVWYSSQTGGGTLRLENGNRQWQSGVASVMERDMLGNLVSSVPMQIAALPEARLHHELFPTLYGTFVSLEREDVLVDDYPTSTTDPNAPTTTKLIRDEPIVEFLADGTPLKRWPLVDAIDPRRVHFYGLVNEPIDWAHANAVVHDPRDDSLIASIRHQDCVIKVDRVTGRLKWILGNPSNWLPQFEAMRLQPVGPIVWQYGQHAAKIAPNGNLILFDNGNNRSSPFDPSPPVPPPDNYSRAVEFAIDEDAMEVTQVWEWSDDQEDRIYSFFLSDADPLPQTGNVLIDFGGTSHMGGVATTALGYGTNVVRLIEVTHDTPGVVVMDILLSHPTTRITSYRAEHWPSLYPPDATRIDP